MNDEPSKFKPTEEQSHIFSLIRDTRDNIIVGSLAGTGKTSTIVRGVEHSTAARVLLLAFNKRIKDAMVEKYKERAREAAMPPAEIRTINSLGLWSWTKTCGEKVVTNPDKMKEVLSYEIGKLRTKAAQDQAWGQTSEIYAAIGLAKSLGYVPGGTFLGAKGLTDKAALYEQLDESPTDLVENLLEQSLATSIKLAYKGNVDYNDQLYMPALYHGVFPRKDLVLVDETQDLNPVQHKMLWHMRQSRIVGVGDDNQSIYAFRGAMPGGMARLKEVFNCTEAALTVSFRCPEEIVKNVHWRVPQMKWFKSGGVHGKLDYADSTTFPDGAAIICRNNAPLYQLAFRLLAAGRNVTVVGSDLGARITRIMEKLGDSSMSQAKLLIAIEQWRMEKLTRGSKTADDMANCMEIFAKKGRTLSDAIIYAETLFAQTGPLTLITGHKAKGLEWENVYHLDPWLIRDESGEQEQNLRYVIQTRALSEYWELNSEEIQI